MVWATTSAANEDINNFLFAIAPPRKLQWNLSLREVVRERQFLGHFGAGPKEDLVDVADVRVLVVAPTEDESRNNVLGWDTSHGRQPTRADRWLHVKTAMVGHDSNERSP
jgi:hypothetical protein